MGSIWHTRTTAEVEATRLAVEVLSECRWAKPLLATIEGAGGVGSAEDGSLFEARFGLALHDLIEIEPKYEHKTGVGDTSVDFAFGPWNVELLALGETDAAVAATWQNGPFFGRTLISPSPIGARREIKRTGQLYSGLLAFDAYRLHPNQSQLLRSILVGMLHRLERADETDGW